MLGSSFGRPLSVLARRKSKKSWGSSLADAGAGLDCRVLGAKGNRVGALRNPRFLFGGFEVGREGVDCGDDPALGVTFGNTTRGAGVRNGRLRTVSTESWPLWIVSLIVGLALGGEGTADLF